MKDFMKEVLSTSIYILVVLCVCFLMVRYVGQRTEVDGESMTPTLQDHDNLIVDKISYRFRDPERFDIIVFPYKYEEDTFYIKRVIGLPGESVRIDWDGNIFINGQILSENYGKEVMKNPGRAETEIILGENEYFVLGDNRNDSKDSRNEQVANIKKEEIIGRAWLRLTPFKTFGLLKDN